MEITTYSEKGGNRVKVFFRVEGNKVTSVSIGNRAVPYGKGFQFYVDDYIAEQIHKCELYFEDYEPKLKLKKGEEIEVPKLSEKEKKRKELLSQLEELDLKSD